MHADLDRMLAGGRRAESPVDAGATDGPRLEPVRGVRRQIAERLTPTWTEIPHITYVDAVDVTELERLRGELNRQHDASAASA